MSVPLLKDREKTRTGSREATEAHLAGTEHAVGVCLSAAVVAAQRVSHHTIERCLADTETTMNNNAAGHRRRLKCNRQWMI